MAYKLNPGIYLITDRKNNRYYVGSSNCIQRRWLEHRSHLRRGVHGNPYLQYAWNKYGEDNFAFEVLEQCPREKLAEREGFWIGYYDSLDRSKGYNISDVERRALSEETKRKISEAHKGKILSEETKRKLSEVNKGKTFTLSEEAKQKISESNKGKAKSEAHREALSKAHKGKQYTEKQKLAHKGKHKHTLTYEQAVEIRKLKTEGKTYKELSAIYGVSTRSLVDIVKFKYHKEGE